MCGGGRVSRAGSVPEQLQHSKPASSNKSGVPERLRGSGDPGGLGDGAGCPMVEARGWWGGRARADGVEEAWGLAAWWTCRGGGVEEARGGAGSGGMEEARGGAVDDQQGQVGPGRGGRGGGAPGAVQLVGGQVPAGEVAAGEAFVPGDVLGAQRRVGPLHQLRPHGAHPGQAPRPHPRGDGHRREGAPPRQVGLQDPQPSRPWRRSIAVVKLVAGTRVPRLSEYLFFVTTTAMYMHSYVMRAVCTVFRPAGSVYCE